MGMGVNAQAIEMVGIKSFYEYGVVSTHTLAIEIPKYLLKFQTFFKICELVLKNPKGLKSGKIASLIGLSKKEVNRILYSNKNMFTVDILFTWKLKQRD